MDDALDLALGTYPSWSRLVVRLALGLVFFAHGAQKVFGWFGGQGLTATMQTFQRYLKIPPAATAWKPPPVSCPCQPAVYQTGRWG